MSDIIDNKDTHYQVMMGSYTVEEFVNQIDKVKYTFNEETKEWDSTGEGILIAPFQRTYQWHMKGHPLYFLDSLHQNIFVMPVILVEHNKQTWILDGQQRLATLYCYAKGYQPLDDNNPIKWKILITAIQEAIKRDTEIEGEEKIEYNESYANLVKPCEWKKLDSTSYTNSEKEKIKQTPIGYSFLFGINYTEKKYKSVLLDIFDRINNQGMLLKVEETLEAYRYCSDTIEILGKIYSDLRNIDDKDGSYHLSFIILRTLSLVFLSCKISEKDNIDQNTNLFIRKLARQDIKIPDLKTKLTKLVKWLETNNNYLLLDSICARGTFNDNIYKIFFQNIDNHHMVQYKGVQSHLFEFVSPYIVMYPLLYAYFQNDEWFFDDLKLMGDRHDESPKIEKFLLKYLNDNPNTDFDSPIGIIFHIDETVYEIYKQIMDEQDE